MWPVTTAFQSMVFSIVNLGKLHRTSQGITQCVGPLKGVVPLSDPNKTGRATTLLEAIMI